jgi:hypothetical protein
MNNFNFDEPSGNRFKGPRLNRWDILSIIVLVITVCMAGFYLMIFINPNIPYNPFPPPPTPYRLPTATITPIQLPATWTATNPPIMTATDTPPPTFTLIPTVTPFSLIPPTNTPKPTSTPKAPFSGSANPYASTVIPHLTDLGCAWQGVGGSVEDANGSPKISMPIRLVGIYNGNPVNLVTVSGTAPDYGRSGFEFTLGTKPIDSTNQLYVQLLNQDGQPQADNLYINTYSDCNKNLILVRFKKRQ